MQKEKIPVRSKQCGSWLSVQNSRWQEKLKQIHQSSFKIGKSTEQLQCETYIQPEIVGGCEGLRIAHE